MFTDSIKYEKIDGQGVWKIKGKQILLVLGNNPQVSNTCCNLFRPLIYFRLEKGKGAKKWKG